MDEFRCSQQESARPVQLGVRDLNGVRLVADPLHAAEPTVDRRRCQSSPASFDYRTKPLCVERSHPHPGGQAVGQETGATGFRSACVGRSEQRRGPEAVRALEARYAIRDLDKQVDVFLAQRVTGAQLAQDVDKPSKHPAVTAAPQYLFAMRANFPDESAIAVEQVLLAIEQKLFRRPEFRIAIVAEALILLDARDAEAMSPAP